MHGKPDLLVINAVITCRGMVGADCLNSKIVGWKAKPRKLFDAAKAGELVE